MQNVLCLLPSVNSLISPFLKNLFLPFSNNSIVFQVFYMLTLGITHSNSFFSASQ